MRSPQRSQVRNQTLGILGHILLTRYRDRLLHLPNILEGRSWYREFCNPFYYRGDTQEMGLPSRPTKKAVQGCAEIEQYYQTFDDVSNRIYLHQRSRSHRESLRRARRRRRDRRCGSNYRIPWADRLHSCSGRGDCHRPLTISYRRKWCQSSRYVSISARVRACEQPRPAAPFPYGYPSKSPSHPSHPSSTGWSHLAGQRWPHGLLLLSQHRISHVDTHQLLFRYVPIPTPTTPKWISRRRQQPFYRPGHGSARLSRRIKWVSHLSKRSQRSRTTISATKCSFPKCYELTNPPSFS